MKFKVGDKVRVANLVEWSDLESQETIDYFLGKEGTVLEIDIFIGVDIPDGELPTTFWKEEELELIDA